MAEAPIGPPAPEGTPVAPPRSVTLTAPEIAWLIRKFTGMQVARVPISDTERATLVAICQRESGGKTDALRPASSNPLGGNDLGLFQLNDKANAFDEMQKVAALDAVWNAWYSCNILAMRGKRGTDFSPWGGKNTTDQKAAAPGYENSHPLTPTAAHIAAVKNPVDPMPKLLAAGHVAEPGDAREKYKFTGTVTRVDNYVPSVISDLYSWAEGLGKLLSNLLSGAWWKRVGIGALGVLMLIIAFGSLATGSAASAYLRRK